MLRNMTCSAGVRHNRRMSIPTAPGAPPAAPVIGIIGSAGAYGRWLRRFFSEQMQLEVLGHDPADAASAPPEALITRADVLVFAAPIRRTARIIDEWSARAAGREQRQLWLDVTSLKQAPVAAMLRSRADVAGLHPMTAPPKTPTLKGRVLVVCAARLRRWQPWFAHLLQALQGEAVHTEPERHDRIMALVQALVHASHLCQGLVLHEYAGSIGSLAALLPFRSTSFALDTAMLTRIVSMNPAIYQDIQFENPYACDVLAQLAAHAAQLHALIAQGDDAARAAFRAQLAALAQGIGSPALAEGAYTFEQVGYLLADLTERSISIAWSDDQPGALRTLLYVFERQRINLTSIHSSRTPAGALHFRIGLAPQTDAAMLQAAVAEIERGGMGRVLPG